MFRARGHSPSSSSSVSFHSARDKTDDEDEIRTVLATSDSSVIQSNMLDRSSVVTEDISSFRRETRDDDSYYSTAQSTSFDSRYKSETSVTASSDGYSENDQLSKEKSTTYYSDAFESADSSGDSSQTSKSGSDFDDSLDAQRSFIKAKLRLIKHGHRKPKQDSEEVANKEILEDQNAFITHHLNTLRQSVNTGTAPKLGRTKRDRAKTRTSGHQQRKPTTSDVVISRGFVDKLRIQNLLHNMRKISREPLHEPDTCEKCRMMQEDVAQRTFTQERHRMLNNSLVEEKYQRYIVTNDPLTQVGALASTLPKLSDDPKHVWDRLLQKGVT